MNDINKIRRKILPFEILHLDEIELKLLNGVVLKGKDVTTERIKAEVEKMERIKKKYKDRLDESKEQE